LRLTISLVLCLTVFALGLVNWPQSAAGQTAKFSSLYTDLKRDCRAAIKLKKGEDFQGDMPLKCKGYGGYEINIGYKAMSSQFAINLAGQPGEDAVVSTMQPLDYDLKRKVEWRLADGQPFAVIYRIDLTKGDTSGAMWAPENKTGESLVIKGLKGFAHIDFEVNAKTVDANAKAREMADAAYARKS